MAGEPEAVDRATQQRLSALSAERTVLERRAAWARTRARIEAELAVVAELFGAQAPYELRGVRREIDRLARRL
jgi:hypothetical protein